MAEQDFNSQVIEEFRANGGKVGGMFEGAPMLLLHHTGAKSGQERVTPLVYLDDNGQYVIFASKAGAPTNPAWYHNLVAHPETSIEVGPRRCRSPPRRSPAKRASACSRSRCSAIPGSPIIRRRPAIGSSR